MEKLTTIRSVAAPMLQPNLDTDMIIPSQYLRVVTRNGLGKHAFHNIRYDHAGNPLPDFVLNQPAYQNAQILIGRENFGCGSSREHAVWALMEIGIRCIIAPSFGQIFANNSIHNGLLLVALPEAKVEELLEKAAQGANAIFTVDLQAQEITEPDGSKVSFEIEPYRKEYLLQGSNDRALIARKRSSIEAFERAQRSAQPWIWNTSTNAT